jgi:hypothetical protein
MPKNSSIFRMNAKIGKEITRFLVTSDKPKNVENVYADLKIVYYYFDENKYVAVDNRTRDCYIEEFSSEVEAICWCSEGESHA